jgi:CRP-like cAMP-binding protein
MSHSQNRLLASLPDDEFASYARHFKTVAMALGNVVANPGDAVRHVYFPHSGVISLVVELSVGAMIETAMVGRNGALNATAALDGNVSFNKAIVQLAGSASIIEVKHLRDIAEKNHAFRALLLRHDQVLFAEAQQSAACNGSHSLDSRMCRWLLRMRDLADADDLTLTQEFLAQMLGVRRPSVSIVANTLQKAGFIRYRRGNIRILNLEGMKEGACECYEAVKGHYDSLLPNFKKKSR